MLGSTFATVDPTSAWGGFATPLPDAVANVVTLQLRNQDNFGSVYGLRGALTDHLVTVRNLRESPRSGSPLITRHSCEYAMIVRETVAGGIVTQAIPYVCSVVLRLPATGSALTLATMLGTMSGRVLTSAGLVAQKMMNFES